MRKQRRPRTQKERSTEGRGGKQQRSQNLDEEEKVQLECKQSNLSLEGRERREELNGKTEVRRENAIPK